jgi:adenosylhomocysteine nucleosidase
MSGGGASEAEAQRERTIPVAPAPSPVDVGIVAAISVEVGFLLDRLANVRKYAGPKHSVIEGECGGKVVAVMVAGMGRAAAKRGAQLLVDGHRPRAVLSAGFAGALDPAFERNDLFLADEVADLEGRRFAAGVAVPLERRAATVKAGRLLTVDRIVRTAVEKAELHERFEASAVDMESSGVAEFCAERAIPFYSIRIISDDARSDLPEEVATLISRSGSYRVGAALRALWNRPSSLKDFWRLHEQAHEAADRLAAFAVAAIGLLP